MFAGGVGRIFSEFDTFLERAATKQPPTPSNKPKKKNNKKLYYLLENFLDETACLLNIDRTEYESGKLPWGLIFYNRMLSAQTLLSVDKYKKYVDSFEEYIEVNTNNKKKQKKKQHYIKNAKSLLQHLKLHKVDPDSVLIGLHPSKTIRERFEELKTKPFKHSEEANKLQMIEPDVNYGLYSFGFPGRCGDIVVLQVDKNQENIKNQLDLRNKKFGGEMQTDKDNSITIFGRVQNIVEFNKTVYVNVFLAPKEDTKVSVKLENVIPLRFLIPPGVSWMGNVQQMRDMVSDPYDGFSSIVKSKMIDRLHEMLKNYSIDFKQLYDCLQKDPVSFLYYHIIKDSSPVISVLATPSDGNENLQNNSSQTQQINDIREKFILEWEQLSKSELQKFIEEINQQDGSTNKLFMPTCEQDLMRLNRLNFKQIAISFLESLHQSLHRTINGLESERRELMKGNLKNQLSKWWLLLIKTQYELLLAKTSYDESAWNEDTYIDEAPSSIDGVRSNLQVVQELINTKSELHKLVIEFTEDIKREVYPVIDDFIMKAHIVLSSEILGTKISCHDYSPDHFDLEHTKKVFNSKKESMEKENGGPELVEQFDDLMKDLKYLVEMKKLEFKSESNKNSDVTTGGKLELSYAVPLSGLIMGCFMRLENILKTILELWVPKQKPVVSPTLSPTLLSPRSINSPSNSSPPKIPTKPNLTRPEIPAKPVSRINRSETVATTIRRVAPTRKLTALKDKRTTTFETQRKYTVSM